MNIWIFHEDSIIYLPFWISLPSGKEFAMEEMAAIYSWFIYYLSKNGDVP